MTASTPATPDPRVSAISEALSRDKEPRLRRGEYIPDYYRVFEEARAALASLAAELAENDAWGDEMAEYAREHGLPAALDHMRLIGLANIANDLSRELAATRQALEQIRQILHECLWDEDFWQPEDLVELMERVYVLAGGDMSRAVLAGEDTT